MLLLSSWCYKSSDHFKCKICAVFQWYLSIRIISTLAPDIALISKTSTWIHSFHLCMISGNRNEAWPMYHVWPISERFMLEWSGGTWPACCHWPNTGRVNRHCPIMFVLTQSYPCDAWFVCSILRELAVSNLGQLLFCLSIMWSRCQNAYQDLWIMTI